MKIGIKLLLVLVFIFRSIATGFSVDNNDKLNGVWQNGPFTLIVEGNIYTSKLFNLNYGRGIVIYDENNITLVSSHAWDHIRNQWRQFNEEINGQYIFQRSKITIFNVEGRYRYFNGIWERLDIDRGQNITSI